MQVTSKPTEGFRPFSIEIAFESAQEQKVFRHLVGCGSECSIESLKKEIEEMGQELNNTVADLSFPA